MNRSSTKKDKKDDRSQAEILVELAMKDGMDLFTDQLSKPYTRIFADDHREIWPIKSRHFKNWLSKQYWEVGKKVPSQKGLLEAINVLEGRARFGGNTYSLHNRVASHKGAIYYDLADATWRAVKVEPGGWEIVDDPPILFRRHSHQQRQVEPTSGEELEDLFRFVNLKEPSQRLLYMVDLVSCLVPTIPHPVAVHYGPQGSAKTTACRIRRRIIDPSAIETLTFPNKTAELVQQLSHHWAPIYDNVSQIPTWLSDSLCRAATGEGFSKRGLYTDDEDIIYQFRCCLALNGINVTPRRADLLDRSHLYFFGPIERDQRELEETILDGFEEIRSALFGAALDALSSAMLIKPHVRIAHLPRMADFAVWGTAIALALDHTEEEFFAALNSNEHLRNDEALAANPVATAVLAFMESKKEWTGSSTALLAQLERIAGDLRIDRRDGMWPKAPHILTRRLNEIRSNLAMAGIEVVTGERTTKQRSVTLRSISEESWIGTC